MAPYTATVLAVPSISTPVWMVIRLGVILVVRFLITYEKMWLILPSEILFASTAKNFMSAPYGGLDENVTDECAFQLYNSWWTPYVPSLVDICFVSHDFSSC
jgi:hypothetical protein